MNKITAFSILCRKYCRTVFYFRIALLIELIIRFLKEKYNNIYDLIADLCKSFWSAKEK